ncbi:DUF4174 domain-containing protein [Spirosoma sp. KNUC1025]|uniref:DUF4174 domain-containing protein n=1 Tax=Spirosoma sp. KNUC1025 TaxID=2894082 RepID=UPI00386DB925|nr:DUF4174 domain-containing protein [Spirosoma sp. KNUC1025]
MSRLLKKLRLPNTERKHYATSLVVESDSPANGTYFFMESVANQQKSLKAILHEKKDHRRVLLLYGRDDTQHYLIEQQEALIEQKDGLAERDLDVLVLVASEVSEPDRQFLMHDYKLVPSDSFAGWLIGKDGGIKETYKKPVSTKDLFKSIDSMPMRKQEAKQ